jgi:hypothetical protein
MMQNYIFCAKENYFALIGRFKSHYFWPVKPHPVHDWPKSVTPFVLIWAKIIASRLIWHEYTPNFQELIQSQIIAKL